MKELQTPYTYGYLVVVMRHDHDLFGILHHQMSQTAVDNTRQEVSLILVAPVGNRFQVHNRFPKGPFS